MIEDSSRERKDLLKLRKISRKLEKNDFTQADLETFNKEITGFNKRYQENVETINPDLVNIPVTLKVLGNSLRLKMTPNVMKLSKQESKKGIP